LAGRVLVAGLVLGGAALYGQTAQSAGTVSAATIAAQGAALQGPLSLKMDDADAGYSSSSSQTTEAPQVAANTADHFNFVNAMQYGGGRQRSGRPRYRGSNSNADGSAKWDFYAGGGFGLPTGDQTNYLSTGWGIQAGVGRNFNHLLGVNAEFDYDHFGMTNSTIDNYAGLYGDPTNTNGFGGNSHIWSMSLNPIVNLRSGEGLGAYVTGGVGFYHKVANFTLPEQSCDPYILELYGICEPIAQNVNVDHYTSNAPGFNIGLGATYKFSRFASERFYGEVRYVRILNQYRPGLTSPTDTTYTGYNYFPLNSQKTSYLPVKLGLRF
jgi:opacity protein-like surface antigen